MWGYHLILDVGGCNVEKMNSKTNIENCIKALMQKTKMKPLGKTIFEYVEPTEETITKKIDGYTAIQIISTSSIVMHFVNSQRAIFIDFFSCKQFHVDDVENIIFTYFDATVSKKHYLHRDIVYDNIDL